MADSFEGGKSFYEPKNNGLLNGGAAPARLLSQHTRHTSLLSAVELNYTSHTSSLCAVELNGLLIRVCLVLLN